MCNKQCNDKNKTCEKQNCNKQAEALFEQEAMAQTDLLPSWVTNHSWKPKPNKNQAIFEYGSD